MLPISKVNSIGLRRYSPIKQALLFPEGLLNFPEGGPGSWITCVTEPESGAARLQLRFTDYIWRCSATLNLRWFYSEPSF